MSGLLSYYKHTRIPESSELIQLNAMERPHLLTDGALSKLAKLPVTIATSEPLPVLSIHMARPDGRCVMSLNCVLQTERAYVIFKHIDLGSKLRTDGCHKCHMDGNSCSQVLFTRSKQYAVQLLSPTKFQGPSGHAMCKIRDCCGYTRHLKI